MKKHKLTIITYLLAAVFGVSLLSGCTSSSNDGVTPAFAFADNHSTPSADRLMVRGVVESVESRNVYTTLGYRVERIDVAIGEQVTEGQILAVLDTGDLELTIAQQRLEIEMLQKMVELVPVQRRAELETMREMAESIPLQRNAELETLRRMAELIPVQRNAELNLLRQNNQNTIQENQRLYDEAVANLENNTNMHILNAEALLNAAEMNLTVAQRNYDNALKDNEEGKNLHILSADSALNNARIELETVKSNHERFKLLYEAGGLSRNELRQFENTLTHAQNAYDDARTNYNSAVELERRTLELLEIEMQSALSIRNEAQIMLDTTRLAARQEIDMLRSNLTTAQIASDLEPMEVAVNLESMEIAGNLSSMEIATNLESREIANKLVSMELASNLESIELISNLERMRINLQILEKQLEDSTIKAPISGTVTAVNAKEGTTVGSGHLFVIEDTENLRIATRFREYDITRIQTGMEVSIRSDAVGNAVHAGTISRINPAAVNNASAAAVEFEVLIAVTSQNTGLRIGMNTTLEVLLNEAP